MWLGNIENMITHDTAEIRKDGLGFYIVKVANFVYRLRGNVGVTVASSCVILLSSFWMAFIEFRKSQVAGERSS